MKTLLAFHLVQDPVEKFEHIIKAAADAKAHLNIVIVGLQPPVAAATYPGSLDYSWVESFKQVLEETKLRTAEIKTLVQKADLSASVNFECTDVWSLEGLVSQYAIHVDAALFAGRSVLSQDVMRRTFDGTLFAAGRPVIVLGNDPESLPTPRRALFAWDSEPEAAKALHNSLGWLDESCKAHVLVVDPDGFKSGPNPGDDIAAFLARKQIDVSVDRMPKTGKTVAEAILEHATDVDAELIVMGAYGHSRLRERLLGGTTREILENAKTPVFMAH